MPEQNHQNIHTSGTFMLWVSVQAGVSCYKASGETGKTK